jgi:HD domain
MDDDQASLIGQAAALHDVGKLAIPDAILLKRNKLADHEFEQLKTHTTAGAAILGGRQSTLMQPAEQIALTHHERWDGTGYPNRLAGEDIPMTGRIVALADVFDALTHPAPTRRRGASMPPCRRSAPCGAGSSTPPSSVPSWSSTPPSWSSSERTPASPRATRPSRSRPATRAAPTPRPGPRSRGR